MTKVLDSVVIKLEDGTDFDLKCLEKSIAFDETTTPAEKEDSDRIEKDEMEVDGKIRNGMAKSESKEGEDGEIENDEDITTKLKRENSAVDESMTIENMKKEEEDGEIENDEDTTKLKQENKDELNKEYNEFTEQNQSLDNTVTSTTKEEEEIDGKTKEESLNETAIEQSQKLAHEGDELKEEKFDANQNLIEDKSQLKVDEEMNDNEEGGEQTKVESTVANEDNKELFDKVKEEREETEENLEAAVAAKDEKDEPRPLHRTLSIFLRYLPANVTKVEIENMFKSYSEFSRVALADPTFDKRFQRRGWVTFNRKIDIRKIYLSLNNVRIRDCEIGAIINRDLSRRIRSVNGIASHRVNVLADLKHTTKIILNLDEEKGIWHLMAPAKSAEEETEIADGGEKEEAKEYRVDGLLEPITIFDQQTRNPLLIDIEACFKEKSSEDEEIKDETGEIKEEEPISDQEPKPLERDEELIKVLDKLIFYLRVVHSLDFYNHIDYPNEDEMPNRIGIMHARGMLPTANISQREVNDYMRRFEQNIATYLERVVPLKEDELEKLGKRKVNDEIEKFINDNTKELKTDKWLCPLSGKKFKGPEFVRKHIETKHEDKLEIVRHETEFFNLYLTDPRRPQLAEHQFNRPNPGKPQQLASSNDNHGSNNYASNIHQRINFNQGGSNYNRGYNNSGTSGSSGYNNYNRGGNNRFNNNR